MNIGLFITITAFFIGIIQLIAAAYGFKKNNFQIMKKIKKIGLLQIALILSALAVLAVQLVTLDFSNAYVSSQANLTLPWYYRIAGIWSAKEGSLLLWSGCLAIWTLLLILRGKKLPLTIHSTSIGLMGGISSLFLLAVFQMNPFETLPVAPWSGIEMQAILQDINLMIHPLFLYMGYTGFAIPFSLTIAALIQRKVNSNWAEWAEQWTKGAWFTLTIGIVLGSFWAYNELGWGGVWFWDPVENASLFPWLAGLAALHSLWVFKKTKVMQNASFLMILMTFILSLIGTFLVRSGLVISVHSFANGGVGNWLLIAIIACLLLLCCVVSLYYFLGKRRTPPRSIKLFSTAHLLQLQSYTVLFILLIVVWGSLYPLISTSLYGETVAVGAPYYQEILFPFLCLLLLMMTWFHATYLKNVSPLKIVVLLALISTLLTAWIYSHNPSIYSPLILLFLWIFITNILSVFYTLFFYIKHKNYTKSFMPIAHLGFALMTGGLVGNTVFSQLNVQSFSADQPWLFADYELVVNHYSSKINQNYTEEKWDLDVQKNKRSVASLSPTRRTYLSQETTTESAVHHGWLYDLHVTIGERINKNTIQVGFAVKYMTVWVWLGGLIIGVLGLLSLLMIKPKIKKRAPYQKRKNYSKQRNVNSVNANTKPPKHSTEDAAKTTTSSTTSNVKKKYIPNNKKRKNPIKTKHVS